jgi:hypothetical protein
MLQMDALLELAGTSRDGLSVEITRDGKPTIRVDGQYLHSVYSPEKEARRLVEPVLGLDPAGTLAVFFGSGLGYHIEILERAGFGNILVIERDRRVFDLFLRFYRPITEIFLIGPDDPVEKIDSVLSRFEIQAIRNIKTVVLRGGYRKEFYSPFEERLERLLKVKLGDFSTRMKFEELWFINILRNVEQLRWTCPIHEVMYRDIGLPVMVISAGPSLKFSLPWIGKLNGRCVTIAVDTAVLPLAEAGIVPDFVYSLDSQVHNLNDLAMVDRAFWKRTRLVFDAVVSPTLPLYFRDATEGKGAAFMSNTAHMDIDYDGNTYLVKNELVNWLEASGGFRIGDVETGGSVATSAFHMAYLIGGNPIVLIGQDLAYSYRASHSPSTSHLYRALRKTNRLKPIESVFLGVMEARKAFPVASLDGGVVETDFVLDNFRGWFRESAKNILRLNPGIRLLNSSLTGAAIEGFERMEPEELYRRLESGKKKPAELLKILPNNLMTAKKLDKIMGSLEDFRRFALGVQNLGNALFERIERSDFSFLRRYFMREKVLFEKYGNFDSQQVERKFHRLHKNLEMVLRHNEREDA